MNVEQGNQFDPIIGRISATAWRASSASAGNGFELLPHFRPCECRAGQSVRHNHGTNFSNPHREHHQHQLDMVLSCFPPFRPCECRAGQSVRPNHWTNFSNPHGEHHQHQLEMALNCFPPFAAVCMQNRAISSTQSLDEFQQPAWRAPSASAGNGFELTPPSPAG